MRVELHCIAKCGMAVLENTFTDGTLVMNKHAVVDRILAELNSQLELARGASQEAAEYATHEEAKADSKWDTQGLEASYLAAGQAAQVLEIGKTIQVFHGYLEDIHVARVRVEAGSLFEVNMNGMGNWFFLSSAGGGVSVGVDGKDVTVLTPKSPVAGRVMGRSVGESFLFPNGIEGVLTRLL